MSSVYKSIQEIKNRIAQACSRTGRSDKVRLMAVSKTRSREEIDRAAEAGITLFGENRVQELQQKYNDYPDEWEVHMIGHLQRNKAKHVVPLVDWVDSIDKIETARELEKRCSANEKTLNILLEVNTSEESSKSGYRDYDTLLNDLDIYQSFKYLQLRGLMTIAPYSSDEALVRGAFSGLYKKFEDLQRRMPDQKIDTLSMGMSSDFEWAVEEGSTLVRVGTKIFGERTY